MPETDCFRFFSPVLPSPTVSLALGVSPFLPIFGSYSFFWIQVRFLTLPLGGGMVPLEHPLGFSSLASAKPYAGFQSKDLELCLMYRDSPCLQCSSTQFPCTWLKKTLRPQLSVKLPLHLGLLSCLAEPPHPTPPPCHSSAFPVTFQNCLFNCFSFPVESQLWEDKRICCVYYCVLNTRFPVKLTVSVQQILRER